MITRLFGVLLVSALVGINQPAPAASGGAASAARPPVPVKTVQPKNLPDAQIERTIKAKLAKSKLNADHFTVSVHNGVATIEGNTSVMQHKGVMTRLAKTSGATGVRNNIRVSDDARARAASQLAKNRTSTGSPHATVALPVSAR